MPKQNNPAIVDYDDDGEEIRTELPWRWTVCDSCNGNATTTRHIECDGGGFTASEWAEACSDDPEFSENYFGGVYDRPCPDCDGGKVKVVDEEAAAPELLARYNEYLEDRRAEYYEHMSEMRYNY